MSINEYPNCKSLIINALKSRKFSGLKEARKQFLINILLCFLSIKGRINFLQLARFSEYCEQYYRIHFENKFNFQDFNLTLITGQQIKECVVAFDPSYIPKSGKETFGTGRSGRVVPNRPNGVWISAVLPLWMSSKRQLST